jgi:hypothetical protein
MYLVSDKGSYDSAVVRSSIVGAGCKRQRLKRSIVRPLFLHTYRSSLDMDVLFNPVGSIQLHMVAFDDFAWPQ